MKTKLLYISLLFLGLAGGIWHFIKPSEKPEYKPQTAATSPAKKPKRAPSVSPANTTVTFSLLASFDETSSFNPSTVKSTQPNPSN